MSKPKLPSQLHPDYPKGCYIPWVFTGERHPISTVIPVRREALIDFYTAHPEFADEGEYEFQCEMCGGHVDDDYCYCIACGDHAGEWVLIKDGEVVE